MSLNPHKWKERERSQPSQVCQKAHWGLNFLQKDAERTHMVLQGSKRGFFFLLLLLGNYHHYAPLNISTKSSFPQAPYRSNTSFKIIVIESTE